MAKTMPYYCPLCLDEKDCGYHGVLAFEGAAIPTCNHHTSETEETALVKMVPVAGRKRERANSYARRD